MEPGNDFDGSRDYLRRAVDNALFLDAEIVKSGKPLPVLSAIIHAISHLAKGGDASNFKPVVRTRTYAGIDRRQMYGGAARISRRVR